MAEEILVKEPLTKEMIDAGEQLRRRLKSTDLEVVGLFWLYDLESGDWNLTLVSPQVETEGPREVYDRIWDLLHSGKNGIPGLDTLHITALSPNNKLVRALANANDLVPLSGKRLSRMGLNGIYVEDIYVYFIDKSVEPLPDLNWISH